MARRGEQAVLSEPDGHHDSRETHPAFGVAVVTRGTGSGRTLFQSDLRHQETITLSIQTAERMRGLNHDWVHPQKTVVEVELSLAQWGQLVSSIGIGSGVPVTMRYTETKGDLPGLPFQPRIGQSIREVRGAVGKMLARARETFEVLEEAVEQKRGVKATREALAHHKHALNGAEANADFAVQSMAEASEHLTGQAVADIEAHILRAAELTGLESPVVLPSIEVGDDA